MSEPSPTDVDVVVVTHNSARVLTGCLDALGGRYPVIVADNDSADETLEVAARHDRVQVLRTGGNVGYGRAANLALAASDKPYVLLINPDVEIAPAAVAELREALVADPGAALAGPRICDANGAVARSYGPALFDPGHELFKPWLPHALRRSTPWTPLDAHEPVPVGYLAGCALMMRAGTVRTIGGFDEAIFLYYEETDLCLRLTEGGHRVLFVPQAEARHLVGRSSETDDPAWLSNWHLEWSRFHLARKYAARAGGTAVLTAQLARLVLKAGLHTVARHRAKRRLYAARASGAWARLRGMSSFLR